MGQEEDKDTCVDEEKIEVGIDLVGLSSEEVIMLAFALEYECNDRVHNLVNDILEKIEHKIHLDAYVGSRISEYGHIMGWNKE